MTVFYRLIRNQTFNGNSRIISAYASKRLKVDAVDPVISISSAPLASQSVSSPQKKPLAPKFPRWENYEPFLQMMDMRRDEAQRSILIEIEDVNDSGDLKSLCETYGAVNKCFMYRVSGKIYVLVEFKSKKAKNSVMENAFHTKDPQAIPVTSPCLYFRHKRGTHSEPPLPDSSIRIKDGEEKILHQLHHLDSDINQRLKKEILYVYQNSQISDLSIRLRFFTCNQIDTALSGLFASVKALPFGSSVSGFGRSSGDLDIYLEYRRNLSIKENDKSKLFFHSKAWLKDKNLQLKVIGDMISILLPGCSQVLSILSARVPIIKYHQSITNLDCDLQNSSISGLDLSHILWIMRHWDVRVAPIVYTLRIWAAHNNVVSAKRPAPFITNFSLVIMIIFYLQNEKILPSLHFLNNITNCPSTKSLDSEAGLQFPDLRKIAKKSWEENEELEVDALLINFFKFYSSFDFEMDRISIFHGRVITKTSFGHLEIENPVDPSLNIARNVTRNALQVFRRAATEAYNSLGKDDYKSQSLRKILRINGPESNVSDAEARPSTERKKKNR